MPLQITYVLSALLVFATAVIIALLYKQYKQKTQYKLFRNEVLLSSNLLIKEIKKSLDSFSACCHVNACFSKAHNYIIGLKEKNDHGKISLHRWYSEIKGYGIFIQNICYDIAYIGSLNTERRLCVLEDNMLQIRDFIKAVNKVNGNDYSWEQHDYISDMIKLTFKYEKFKAGGDCKTWDLLEESTVHLCIINHFNLF